MRYFLLFVFFIFISCNKHKDTTSVTYLGGEVINPNTSYVVLYKDDKVIDTASLDTNNRFHFKLDSINDGLYYFVHSPEEQYVYLEEGDSILMRLNTVEFDESLIFSGKGAEVNNFLIEMFLMNEDEEKLVYDYYKLDPAAFTHKVDSLREMKNVQLANFLEEHPISEDAEEIIHASIDFINYQQKEQYPYMHKMLLHEKVYKELPDSLTGYRSGVNLNNKKLSYFFPYFKYCTVYFNNISYKACLNSCTNEVADIERTYHFHAHKVHLIDSIVKEPSLRGILFRNAAYAYLFEDRNIENNTKYIKLFNEVAKNDKHFEDVNQLYANIRNLDSGNPLPKAVVQDSNSIDNSLLDIAKNNTSNKNVFYFWSLNQKAYMKNTFKRVLELQQKYPNYSFIGINLNDNKEQWMSTLLKYKLDTHTQFYGSNSRELQKTLIINRLNKVIITDTEGKIVDGFSNLYDKEHFE